MKCTFEDNNIIVYMPKNNLTEQSFEDLPYIEEYFKKILLKIKERYNIDINGFCNVNVYIDHLYGTILNIKEEQLEFIEYYDDTIDMKISICQKPFLYEVQDVLPIILNKNYEIYYYQNKWYVKPKNLIDDKELYLILEHSKIIYKETERIIKYGKKI